MPASDCQAATDPIQQLFADKVKEYAKKKAAAGGKLPDATKETEAAIAMELEKVCFKQLSGILWASILYYSHTGP